MKGIIAALSLCFLHLASAGLVLDDIDVSEIARTIKRPEKVCRLAAYASAVECTHRNASGNDTLNEVLSCMSDVVAQYLHCTDIDIPDLDGRRSMSDVVQYLKDNVLSSSLYQSAELGLSVEDLEGLGISLSAIKCIVNNVLDLIKCVVHAVLVDKVPFEWDWQASAKCLEANVPKYITCLTK